VGRYQNGGGTAKEQEDYFAYKKRLSAAILRAPREGFFSSRTAAPVMAAGSPR
jgi:hypothetical protein